jgi:SHS family lactate transporter-like MFS transporter
MRPLEVFHSEQMSLDLSQTVLTCFKLGFLAWTWDAFDYHSVTLSYPDLTQEFDKSLTELTLAVTLTLMTRPIGGIIFGILSDRYGRKLPFIGNCALLIFFVLGTALCRNYASFIAVRALFGIAMGGIYGNAAATALEDCPVEARGLLSGLFQSGYAFGYVLAAAFYEAFHGTSQGWRSMFWFGSAIAVLLIVFRLWVPETQVWRARRRQGNHHPTLRGVGSEVLLVLKHHWLLLSYLVFLLMGLSYSVRCAILS